MMKISRNGDYALRFSGIGLKNRNLTCMEEGNYINVQSLI